MNIAKAKWKPFGTTQSAVAAQDNTKPVSLIAATDVKKIGLTNFGNTCYANSVIQALYFCGPFRDLLMQAPDPSVPPELSLDPPPEASAQPQPLMPIRRKPERQASSSVVPTAVSSISAPLIPTSPPTLFSALRSLFIHIYRHPIDSGKVAPQAFITKLRELNELFRSTMHQDAHEFLNYLLNRIVEELEEEKRSLRNKTSSGDDVSNPTPATSSNSGTSPDDATLVHNLFEGVLTSETRCLTCETVSSRDESFLDLSIDIEQNSSVSACLRQFSASEMLCQANKFFCDSCCDLQEAEKRMKIKKLPNVLALHLKRFKYQEDVQKYIKLAYRVAFPFELRLFNTTDDTDDADRLYELFGIVVHIGSGPHHGHYISIVKTDGNWFVFDDESIESIKESEIPKYFGDSNSSAYVLYYQAVDIDLVKLGLRPPPVETPDAVETLSEYPPQPQLPPGLMTNGSAIAKEICPEAIAPPSPQASLSLPISLTTRKKPGDLSLITSSNSESADLAATHSPTLKTPSSSKGSIFKRSPSMSTKTDTVKRKVSVDNHELIPPPLPPTVQINGVDSPKSPSTPLERKASVPWFRRKNDKKEKHRSGTTPSETVFAPTLEDHSQSLPSPVSPRKPVKRPATADNPHSFRRPPLLMSSNSSIALPLISRPAEGSESPALVSTSSSTSSDGPEMTFLSQPQSSSQTPFSSSPLQTPNLCPPSPSTTMTAPQPNGHHHNHVQRKSPSAPLSPSHRKSLSRFFPIGSNSEGAVLSPRKSLGRPKTSEGSAGGSSSVRMSIRALPTAPLPPPPTAFKQETSNGFSTLPRPSSMIQTTSSNTSTSSSAAYYPSPHDPHIQDVTPSHDDVIDISADSNGQTSSNTTTYTNHSESHLNQDQDSTTTTSQQDEHDKMPLTAEPGEYLTSDVNPESSGGGGAIEVNGTSHAKHNSRTSTNGTHDDLRELPPVLKPKRTKRKLSLTAPMLGFGKKKS